MSGLRSYSRFLVERSRGAEGGDEGVGAEKKGVRKGYEGMEGVNCGGWGWSQNKGPEDGEEGRTRGRRRGGDEEEKEVTGA
eukprot:746989-Hanusia_phi.AAC.1